MVRWKSNNTQQTISIILILTAFAVFPWKYQARGQIMTPELARALFWPRAWYFLGETNKKRLVLYLLTSLTINDVNVLLRDVNAMHWLQPLTSNKKKNGNDWRRGNRLPIKSRADPELLPQQPISCRADPGKYQPRLEPISCHHLTWIGLAG